MGCSTMVDDIDDMRPENYFKPQKNGKKLKETFDDVYEKLKILNKRLKVLENK